jgi:hypothetical protein
MSENEGRLRFSACWPSIWPEFRCGGKNGLELKGGDRSDNRLLEAVRSLGDRKESSMEAGCEHGVAESAADTVDPSRCSRVGRGSLPRTLSLPLLVPPLLTLLGVMLALMPLRLPPPAPDSFTRFDASLSN